jgi:hypothetical protein
MATTPRSKTASSAAPSQDAAPPQVVLEYDTLQGQKLRVVIKHAPGIDYFVDVESLKDDKWTPVKRDLRTLFSPAHAAVEVAVLQLAQQLADAKKLIAEMQKPA